LLRWWINPQVLFKVNSLIHSSSFTEKKNIFFCWGVGEVPSHLGPSRRSAEVDLRRHGSHGSHGFRTWLSWKNLRPRGCSTWM
jgi:hypothetical protein